MDTILLTILAFAFGALAGFIFGVNWATRHTFQNPNRWIFINKVQENHSKKADLYWTYHDLKG